jgi:predicted nicotinamide N-methyase
MIFPMTDELLELLLSCDKTNYPQVLTVIQKISQLKTDNYESFVATDEPPDHSLVKRNSLIWLTAILKRPPVEDESLLDTVSGLIAALSGKQDQGIGQTVFTFKSGNLRITETSFVSGESLGFQTWGSSMLLAQFIDNERFLVADCNVLELGCGTGLAGLACALKGAKTTFLTDYDSTILENASRNAAANNLLEVVSVCKLDWRNCSHDTIKSTCFDIIIAADCIYDMEHSVLVPKVAKMYLGSPDGRFHVLLPCRSRFQKEQELFDIHMVKEGWDIQETELIVKHTINFRYTVYKHPQNTQ